MSICPVCNGFREVSIRCAKCGESMTDNGKIMDYYDDYSPYMDVELMKMEDGYPETHAYQKCPHLYSCTSCTQNKVMLIKE